jgi:hypothetical protein
LEHERLFDHSIRDDYLKASCCHRRLGVHRYNAKETGLTLSLADAWSSRAL